MFSRYVALGDSQTEGMNDPDGRGGYRGWADRLAVRLAGINPDLGYANLAVRGLRTAGIRATQLDVAVALRPDLASVMAGANDILGSFDLAAVSGELDTMYGRLGETGATVLSCTFPDTSSAVPLGRRLRPRIAALNEAIRELAARHGVVLLDCAAHPALADIRWWSRDRIHLTAAGHARLAEGFAYALGISSDRSWQQPLPPAAPLPGWRRMGGDLFWLARFGLPWLHRHLRGHSTGDGRVAKRLSLSPLLPEELDPVTLPSPGLNPHPAAPGTGCP